MAKRDSNGIYGWFDDADQSNPTYDPPHDAPCLFCGFQVSPEDVRTHSLMFLGAYAARSYFYRTHRTCDDAAPGPTSMDDFVLDMIRRGGN